VTRETLRLHLVYLFVGKLNIVIVDKIVDRLQVHKLPESLLKMPSFGIWCRVPLLSATSSHLDHLLSQHAVVVKFQHYDPISDVWQVVFPLY
jgi:hypothetical protein